MNMLIMLIIFIYVGVTLVLDMLEYFTKDSAYILRLRQPYLTGVYIAVWYLVLLYMYQATPMPFIYFQF